MLAELATATGIARAVTARTISPVELTEETLTRLNDAQPTINAFSQVFADEALNSARRLERELIAGGRAGPLCGVPVAVKELFDVAGHPTTGCCRALPGHVARRDAEVVRSLRRAGAIVVGKTNQDELGCGSTNLTSACGPVSNPLDPSRIAGGSSGGSAAALAAGLVPLAMGSDTGGSIRVPASFCGVVGLKPTTGRLPRDGVMPLAPSMDSPGPMATSMRDLHLFWGVLGASVHHTSDGPPVRRVGLLANHFMALTHPEVAEATELAGRALESLGLFVKPVDDDAVYDAAEVWNRLAWGQFADGYRALLDRPDELSPRTRRVLLFGYSLSAQERTAARRRGERIAAWFRGQLREVDVLLAPATPYPAPQADAEMVHVRDGLSVDVHQGGPSLLTRPVNVAALPAVSVPVGRSHDGLPLGIQLIGPPRREDALLSVASALEATIAL